jgi:hypothetical protein
MLVLTRHIGETRLITDAYSDVKASPPALSGKDGLLLPANDCHPTVFMAETTLSTSASAFLSVASTRERRALRAANVPSRDELVIFRC